MNTSDAGALEEILERIDGRGYKAYRDIRGAHRIDDFELHVDHVQGDPFAAPSRIRVRVPMQRAAIPRAWVEGRVRLIAACDFITRQIAHAIRAQARTRRGSGRSGLIEIDAGGQQVLDRSALVITEDWVEARLQVGLPAAGRRILGREAATLLCRDVPDAVRQGLQGARLPAAKLRAFVECVENQQEIRARLGEFGLVAFVGDGALLPRESGASDLPLRADDVVPFEAPESLRVEFELTHAIRVEGRACDRISGLGIPQGVTLIAGGGYHGKSTLLRALERGVYPHIPGDGREWVISAPGLVKIRSEDGRSVQGVDISAFIGNLPGGRTSDAFSSDDASGSTSQASNIAEALEAGASGLLLDEDTSATNFMMRDARMQALVGDEHEPITPLLDRVRALYDRAGISTLLVTGGCGDYFDVADHVILMRDYRPIDATEEARQIAARYGTQRRVESRPVVPRNRARIPLAASFDASRGRREVKIDVRSRELLLYGKMPIDLKYLDQLVDESQTRAIGNAIYLATQRFMDDHTPLCKILDAIDTLLDSEGLDALAFAPQRGRHPGNFARPRRFEIAAAINRSRGVRMRSHN